MDKVAPAFELDFVYLFIYLIACVCVSKFYHLSPHPPLFSSGTEFQIIGPRPEYPQTTVDKGASAFEFRLYLIVCLCVSKFYHLSPHPPLFSSGTEFQIIYCYESQENVVRMNRDIY